MRRDSFALGARLVARPEMLNGHAQALMQGHARLEDTEHSGDAAVHVLVVLTCGPKDRPLAEHRADPFGKLRDGDDLRAADVERTPRAAQAEPPRRLDQVAQVQRVGPGPTSLVPIDRLA